MDALLRRLAASLGVEPARTGEAIEPHLRFEQPWPQAVTLLVLLASGGLIVWLYRRQGSAPAWYRMLLAGLRIALVVLAVFMLAEAVLSVERTGLPYFVVMIDDSASLGVVDSHADPNLKTLAPRLAKNAGKSEATRIAVAQGWLGRDNAGLLKELQKNHKIKFYLVSTSTRPFAEIDAADQVAPTLKKVYEIEAKGEQSRLGQGIRDVLGELRGVPPTAILFLTDGRTTDGEPLARAAELASRKGVPIFPLALGDPEPVKDLELSDLQVDDVVFADDLVPFQAKLTSRGFAGKEVKISLKRKGPGEAEFRELDSIRLIAPADDQPRKVEINHRPKETGEIVYLLEVEPRDRELRPDNNKIEKTIQVRKEKLKILLFEGAPRYEYRYLKNFLEREETVDLSVVLQSADPEYSEQDRAALPTFPSAKEGKDGLFEYDAAVIGDIDPNFLSSAQMQNLRDFVTEKGGGILFVAGEDYNPLAFKGTPLEPLLPIQLSEARDPNAVGNGVAAFRPRLTAEGRAGPIFRFGDDEASSARIWENLPESHWMLEAPRKQPAAFVLAEHPTLKGIDGNLPIFLYQFTGAGKTMFNAVDDTWHWRMRVGDRYFGRFWLQSLRFLARSKLAGRKQAELSTDRKRYERGQAILVRARFANAGLVPGSGEISAQVERKGQAPRKITLRASPNSRTVFEGVLPPSRDGDYEIRLLPPPVLEKGLPTATFRIDPPAGELEQIPLNEPELIQTAKTSGGAYLTPASTVADVLKALPKAEKVPLDTDPPIPLWNTWPILVLFVVLATAEWILRKRKQMV